MYLTLGALACRTKSGVLYNGRPHQTDLLALANIAELDKDKVCVYNATVCTPLLCENYGEGEKLATLKSGFHEISENAFPPTAERAAEEQKEMEAAATAGAHDLLSVREILDLMFGKRKRPACMQFSTGGWYVHFIYDWRCAFPYCFQELLLWLLLLYRTYCISLLISRLLLRYTYIYSIYIQVGLRIVSWNPRSTVS